MAGARRRQGVKPSMPRVASYTDNYFVFPHPVCMVVVPFGIFMMFTATFSPDSAVSFFPWPVRDFVQYMGRSHHSVCISLCVFAAVAHCVEAAYAGKVCQDKHLSPTATAKWSFMTFLFGITSLIRLLNYKPDKAGNKQH
ncbi:hypothetical protein ACOMHN_066397 [Nucella lapillus]